MKIIVGWSSTAFTSTERRYRFQLPLVARSRTSPKTWSLSQIVRKSNQETREKVFFMLFLRHCACIASMIENKGRKTVKCILFTIKGVNMKKYQKGSALTCIIIVVRSIFCLATVDGFVLAKWVQNVCVCGHSATINRLIGWEVVVITGGNSDNNMITLWGMLKHLFGIKNV